MSAAAQPAEILEAPQSRRFRPDNAEFLKEILHTAQRHVLLEPGAQRAEDKIFAQGLPTGKLESWKYTALMPAVKKVAAHADAADTSLNGEQKFLRQNPETLPHWASDLLDGTPPGSEKNGDHALWHLASAFSDSLYVIDIPPETHVAQPFEFIATGLEGCLHAPRILIRLGQNARASFYEDYRADAPCWFVPLIQIFLEDGAELYHSRLTDQNAGAILTPVTALDIAVGAKLKSWNLISGGQITRHQYHAALTGEEARCEFFAMHLLKESQSGETAITVSHQAENCYSMQTVKSVLKDSSKGAFQGAIHVDQIAQKTDAHQLSNALILDEGAEMNTKPELEIYADDVKCSHGATVGELDEDALFYLRSRGVSKDEARRLLIEAFIGEVLDEIPDEDLKQRMQAIVARWLSDS